MKRWAYVHCRPLLWLLTIGDRRRAKIEQRQCELRYLWAANWLDEQLAMAWDHGRRPNEWLADALAIDRGGEIRDTVIDAAMSQRYLYRSGHLSLSTTFGHLDLKPLYDA